MSPSSITCELQKITGASCSTPWLVKQRGVTFTLVGWFVLQAGLHRDPTQVRGFSGAFVFLLTQPYGHFVLGVVALGFIALGVHSFTCARWMRLLGSRG